MTFPIVSSGLLISCATVAAMRPARASLSALRNASSTFFFSVMSRAIVEAPTRRPSPFRMGGICQRDFKHPAVLCHAEGFQVRNPLSAPQAAKNMFHFVRAIRWKQSEID
jgi:hypothetical protein